MNLYNLFENDGNDDMFSSDSSLEHRLKGNKLLPNMDAYDAYHYARDVIHGE